MFDSIKIVGKVSCKVTCGNLVKRIISLVNSGQLLHVEFNWVLLSHNFYHIIVNIMAIDVFNPVVFSNLAMLII